MNTAKHRRRQGGTRFRYWVATQLNRLPGQCWAHLVSWAEFRTKRFPWSPIDRVCRMDADSCGACYCNKLRTASSATGGDR